MRAALENKRNFDVGAKVGLERFVEVVRPLKEAPGLKDVLKTALKGSIIQDFKANRAKDAFYELEMAASLRLACFDVALKDPDIIVQGNGLEQTAGDSVQVPGKPSAPAR
jgi:hypothetical protein